MPAERIEAPLQLSRCPFCGGEAKLFFIKEDHPYVHRVACVSLLPTISGSHGQLRTLADPLVALN